MINEETRQKFHVFFDNLMDMEFNMKTTGKYSLHIHCQNGIPIDIDVSRESKSLLRKNLLTNKLI